MSHGQKEEVMVSELTLHGQFVGYLEGFNNGRNVISFADEFRQNPTSSDV